MGLVLWGLCLRSDLFYVYAVDVRNEYGAQGVPASPPRHFRAFICLFSDCTCFCDGKMSAVLRLRCVMYGMGLFFFSCFQHFSFSCMQFCTLPMFSFLSIRTGMSIMVLIFSLCLSDLILASLRRFLILSYLHSYHPICLAYCAKAKVDCTYCLVHV